MNRVRGRASTRPARARAEPVYGAPVELTIDAIAAGGDGVGRVDGLVAFVPRTAPGDRVRARLALDGRLARGRLEAIVTPSAERVEPPCPHYTRDRCGGCQLQHLAYDAQRVAKRQIVADAFARVARRPAAVLEVRASARPWRYRRKLTLALVRRGGGWVGGLHPYDAPGDVFALDDCPITDERVVQVWRAVLGASMHLPNAETALRGAVRLVGSAGAAGFALEGGTTWSGAAALADAVPALAAVWWTPEGGRRRLLVDRRADAEPGASFAQVNADVAGELSRAVLEVIATRAPATVIDAYAGAGDTALAVAELGARVTAIELDPEAARFAATRLGTRGRVVVGRVEDELGAALPADLIVLNPPRAGLHERVPATIEAAVAANAGPEVIVYVSCNPATLARDVARLPSYAVARVEPFDMFPQTAHVETLVVLARAGTAAP